MAVFIYDKDALEKLALVEGENYLEWGCHTEKVFGFCSFEAFLKAWQGLEKRNPNIRNLKGKWVMYISVNGNYAIYGMGGWNRYLVKENGEIFFHAGFSGGPADVRLARKAGFRIYGKFWKA